MEEKKTLFKCAFEIVERLQSSGFTSFFAGGAVRDMMLGKSSDDIDIVTSAKPDDVIKLFPHSFMVGAAFGIINVVSDKFNFEVATFREEREYSDGRHPDKIKYTDDPEADALRRDFTINGIFHDPIAGKTYDFVGGREDIRRGIIRTIGEPDRRFSEDYLRILRAVRFAVRFGFELDAEIPPSILKNAPKLSGLSAERIRDELDKMLLGPSPEKAFSMMLELGILKEILPEIADLHGVEQHCEYHPEGDVFQHLLLMLSHMAMPDAETAWSIVLHDAGKPQTKTVDENGVGHFYQHEYASADIAEKVMKRLRFPNKTIENVVHAVRSHMRFAHVDEMRTAKWKRMIAEPTFPVELELHRVDCISSHKIMDNYILMLDRVRELENTVKLPEPLITGADLIALGMKPGPDFGKILSEISDLQLEGKISTKEEALFLLNKKDNAQ